TLNTLQRAVQDGRECISNTVMDHTVATAVIFRFGYRNYWCYIYRDYFINAVATLNTLQRAVQYGRECISNTIIVHTDATTMIFRFGNSNYWCYIYRDYFINAVAALDTLQRAVQYGRGCISNAIIVHT